MRLTQRDLPPYAYSPGKGLHPTRDKGGHSYGDRESPAPLDDETWRNHEDYLFGFDLFAASFFWEAHEVWEGIWHANGRKGFEADLLCALIRVAAFELKFRDGRVEGRETLMASAKNLLRSLSAHRDHLAGIRLDELHGQVANRKGMGEALTLHPDLGDEA